MWATIADVDDVTGVTCTDRDIRRAVSTLETVTGLISGSAESATVAIGTGSIVLTRDGDIVRVAASYTGGALNSQTAIPDWANPVAVVDLVGAGRFIPAGLIQVAPIFFLTAVTSSLAGTYLTAAPHGVDGADFRPDITDRDRHFLKLMTCYQVAFMIDNPDLFSRNDVTSASQDGESANFRNVDSHLFAPLARKAYRRLSWRALTRAGDRAPETTRLNVLSEEYDDSLAWKRM